MISLKALALGAIVAASMMVPDAAKAEDAAAGHEAGAPMMMKMENAFEEADTNKDGSLSLQEFLARHEVKFKEIDANSDSKLTKEEFSAYREAMKKKMGEHHKKMMEEGKSSADVPVKAEDKPAQ